MPVKQLSVFLENKAGQLHGITSLLARNNINIRAISIAETEDYGIVRMIVDDCGRTASLLASDGYIANISDVTVIEVPDVPGGLNSLVSVLSEEKIDIEYMYSLFSTERGSSFMVFKGKSSGDIEDAMRRHGIEIAGNDRLGIC